MGLRHALEADHLAAVASLSARAAGRGDLLRVAGAWAVGHAFTILAVALLWVATGVTLPEASQPYVEATAGVLLIWLGVDLLRRREGIVARVRPHAHDDGTQHAHLHWEGAKENDAHEGVSRHPHPQHPVRRALMVGAVHGVGGSALLGLLASQGALPASALVYAALFGVGATVGMLLLSTVVSLPMGFPRIRVLVAGSTWRVALASISIVVGVWVSVNSMLLVIPFDLGI
jgi:hypothetical protein